MKNPQFFLDLAIKQINDVLSELMVDGIKYEKIGKSEFYSMERFAKDEIESNKENLYNLINQDKTLHNNNVYDSKIEEQFAKDRKSNE